ncbi:MAG: low molecular weight protein arginine phosphatase [Elusimicrobiota bacterium]
MIDPPKKILFVCTGNICRSAMAEHLLRSWSDRRGLGLEVRSCGTAAESWYEVPEHARRSLALEGVTDFTHRPQLVTRDVLRWADVVLVMTKGHREYILGLYPEFTEKTRLLRAEAGFGPQDVSDPMGYAEDVYARCLGIIKESLEALLRAQWRRPQRG